MKAMTLQEFNEVVQFVQKWHYFAVWLKESEVQERNKKYFNMGKWGEHGLNIKYIDSCYDSRDGKIWSVSFRGMGAKYTFSSNHFNAIKPMPKEWRWTTLYKLIMGFLS